MARVLVVDDDSDQVEIRQLILEHAGHDVVSASTPQRALAAFADSKPEVVVMDLRVPRPADGLALIRDLRNLSASVRILVLSGWTEDLTCSREASLVTHCLRKPVRSSELLKLIDGVA